MPTNYEERRDVAENLRNMTVRGECRYAEQFYELLKETIMNSWDYHEFEDVAEHLADLVEPNTCRMKYDERRRGVYCSCCGKRMSSFVCNDYGDEKEYAYPFCCECGAEVVD